MKRIVVMDDEFDILEALRAILESEGYEVVGCDNGLQGMAALEAQKPDLAIVDVMMPHAGGLEVLRRVRESDGLKDLPVLLMSAIKPKNLPQEHAHTAFLQKPFSLDALLETMGRLGTDPA